MGLMSLGMARGYDPSKMDVYQNMGNFLACFCGEFGHIRIAKRSVRLAGAIPSGVHQQRTAPDDQQ